MNLSEIKNELRLGEYAWPGGYPKYFIASDGESLSYDSVRSNWKNIVWSHLNGVRDDWHIQAVDINWEDDNLYCAHSGNRIESAYGEP